MKRFVLAMTTLFAVPVLAQTAPAPGAGVAAAANVWSGMTDNIIKSAEQMPESDYSFKPVASVRTFGQLIGHVAGAQYMFCAAALGEAPRAEGDIEKTVTTKAGLVAAMKESATYCKKAYAQSDASAAGAIKMFGSDQTRMYALMLNAAHNGEHYGNIVTYLRVKGMVPPSSQPQPGQ
jgi:uncharacterized damage-inducible protein DinB